MPLAMSDDTEGRWLTKRELAELRGISVASAYRLIQRRGWRRQVGNDAKGVVRALVPLDWLADSQADSPSDLLGDDIVVSAPQCLDVGPDVAADSPRVIAALGEAVRAWEGRAMSAEARVALLEAEIDRLRAEQDRKSELERQRADRAEERRDALEAEVERMLAEVLNPEKKPSGRRGWLAWIRRR
jgi:uncharacterized small protein (DUF1192 family)